MELQRLSEQLNVKDCFLFHANARFGWILIDDLLPSIDTELI